jgi:hypothetical protein
VAADAEVEEDEDAEGVTAADVESPVTVTVTVEGETEVLVEIPQAASSSKVKGMFLASQSEVWRWMESRYRDTFVRYDYSPTIARKLTWQDVGGTLLGHAAEVRFAVLLLIAHACCVVGAGSTREATEEAAVLIGEGYISYCAFCGPILGISVG